MEMWQVWNHKFSKEPTDHSNPQCASSIELHCPKLGLPPPGAPSVSHWGGAFIDHPCVFHDDHMDFTSCQPYCLRVTQPQTQPMCLCQLGTRVLEGFARRPSKHPVSLPRVFEPDETVVTVF
eukprot:GHVN01031862.1.p1 GENE.GHVN01031862.1~~GHVN01031862.1.p1  ORF type:complete len:122 (+),score=10.91 GHVN01031862.1:172-537(+)